MAQIVTSQPMEVTGYPSPASPVGGLGSDLVAMINFDGDLLLSGSTPTLTCGSLVEIVIAF
jgi:hypothetical protein